MKRPRRDVAFYAPWAGPNIAPDQRPSGGAEVQVVQIARGLAASGADIAVAAYDVPGLPDHIDGMTVLRQWRPKWSAAAPRRVAVLATSLWILLRCNSRTLVQRSAGGTTGMVAVVARLTRTRFIYSSASTADFTFERARYNRVTAALYELGIRWADEIVVQSDEQVALCASQFGRSATVIRSIAQRAEPRDEDTPSDGFLWIGRITSYKNPFAYLRLAERLPHVPFTMVCVPSHDREFAAAVRERASSLANVEVLGPLSRPALLLRTQTATAIVSTSDFEGMPNTLLEGWARGVPALTLSHDPDGLITRFGLGRTARGDEDALLTAAAEIWALRDTDPWRERCLAYVREHHDPERIVAQWAAVLGMSGRPTASEVAA